MHVDRGLVGVGGAEVARDDTLVAAGHVVLDAVHVQLGRVRLHVALAGRIVLNVGVMQQL